MSRGDFVRFPAYIWQDAIINGMLKTLVWGYWGRGHVAIFDSSKTPPLIKASCHALRRFVSRFRTILGPF